MPVMVVDVARKGETSMRYVWAYGSCTAWLVVPFGALLSMMRGTGEAGSPVFIIGLIVGITGVVAIHWAITVLIFRMLQAGDRV